MLRNRLEQIRLQMSVAQGRVITQKEFASFLEVGYSLYNRWAKQHGQPSRESLLRVSKRLNLKVEDLIEEIPE